MSPLRPDLPPSPAAAPATAPAPAPAANAVTQAPPAAVFFDLPPTDVTSIPDVKGFVATVQATGMKPVEMNQNITRGYAQFARVFQTLLEPDFARSGPPLSSASAPNWFAFAPHASDEAGKGMISVEVARQVLDALEGDTPVDGMKLLEELGVEGPGRLAARMLSTAARMLGLPPKASLVLGALATAGNYRALEDPRTLMITATRALELYHQAPGSDAAHKAEALVDTLDHTLAEGNLAIYTDVGGSAQAYLLYRQAVGAPTPAQVLEDFTMPGAVAQDARRAFDAAQALTPGQTPPGDLANLLPGASGASLMLAGLALYEQARTLTDPARKTQLVLFANNCLAWREQHDAVQPCFTPPQVQPGEVSRSAVMRTFTPLLQLAMGPKMWTLSGYAAGRPDRDGRFLTSRATEYNWARFDERWPGILDAFALGYSDPLGLWQFPTPARG